MGAIQHEIQGDDSDNSEYGSFNPNLHANQNRKSQELHHQHQQQQ
jgi:hypothetical protein